MLHDVQDASLYARNLLFHESFCVLYMLITQFLCVSMLIYFSYVIFTSCLLLRQLIQIRDDCFKEKEPRKNGMIHTRRVFLNVAYSMNCLSIQDRAFHIKEEKKGLFLFSPLLGSRK